MSWKFRIGHSVKYFINSNIFITFAMRKIIRSSEFENFYTYQTNNVKEKIDYALNIVAEIKIINTKLAKKIIGSEFYELRISLGNEYRIMIFTIDHENIIEAEQILLLNGFIKKSTGDYKREIRKAQRILEDLNNENKN